MKKVCKLCNITYDAERTRQLFCSIDCSTKAAQNKRWNNFELGNIILHRSARQLLITKYGAKCMECGWDKINKTSGKCPIELDHINGNSNETTIQNTRLLCPNCHSLKSTFKALNKGNGRLHRRKIPTY